MAKGWIVDLGLPLTDEYLGHISDIGTLFRIILGGSLYAQPPISLGEGSMRQRLTLYVTPTYAFM